MRNNRIFKFRVWSKLSKMLIHLANSSSDGYTLGFTYRGHIDLGSCGIDEVNTGNYFDENFIIQQFTGLLDSKGVEIFEGDILAYSYFGYDQYFFEEQGPIYFEDSSFKVNNYTLSSLKNAESFSCKVISHIYE
jgi:uncharacterized phage protein (TIGR01671 family)